MNRKPVLGLLAVVAFFAVIGIWKGDTEGAGAGAEDGGSSRAFDMAGDASRVDFVRWQHPRGLFNAEVPQGWRIEGQIDPQGLDKGAFMIRGFSPDGGAMFAFAHNWQWFMEYQYGPYRPGSTTLESLIVPGLVQNLPSMKLSQVRVAYVGPNKRSQVTDPLNGLPLLADQGSLGLLARNGKGEILAGTLLGETLYMPVPGSPGLWSLRIFSGGLAANRPTEQDKILAIQKRVFESLELSPEFMQAWGDAHARTVESMRTYSRDMERAFGGYLESTRRNSASGKDPNEEWAEMMRGGHYEHDDRTGERYWVNNDYRHWFKNDRGILVGNNTGQPPDTQHNWYATQAR
jgi:hypothetical protein